jgi:hypothetical protein
LSPVQIRPGALKVLKEQSFRLFFSHPALTYSIYKNTNCSIFAVELVRYDTIVPASFDDVRENAGMRWFYGNNVLGFAPLDTMTTAFCRKLVREQVPLVLSAHPRSPYVGFADEDLLAVVDGVGSAASTVNDFIDAIVKRELRSLARTMPSGTQAYILTKAVQLAALPSPLLVEHRAA